MINLLPTTIRQDVSYARRNIVLRSWIIACLISLIGMGAIIGGGYLFLQKEIRSYTDQVASAEASLEAQNMKETQARIDSISSNTKLTIQVLSREVLFSKLIRQLGSALPPNTALSSLQIDGVQGGIQLNASASDFTAATQLQLNLQDSKNGIFEKADINTITCGNQTGERLYPCDVSLRALFGKNNAYVYITPSGGSQ